MKTVRTKILDQRDLSRFLGKIERNGPFPERKRLGRCWIWKGSIFSKTGYGAFKFKRKLRGAHRLCYALYQGKIRDGLTIDHLCRVRLCVNPRHLEPVTRRENILRGIGFAATNAKKTKCPYGHRYTKENTLMERVRGKVMGRSCRICRRRRWREWKAKQLSRAGSRHSPAD